MFLSTNFHDVICFTFGWKKKFPLFLKCDGFYYTFFIEFLIALADYWIKNNFIGVLLGEKPTKDLLKVFQLEFSLKELPVSEEIILLNT